MPHKEILESICSECCPHPEGYCILKEILLRGGIQDRSLFQVKVIEIYKWEKSQVAGEDIGWQAAHMKFVEEGYAELFSTFYHPDKTPRGIYTKMKEEKEKRNGQLSPL